MAIATMASTKVRERSRSRSSSARPPGAADLDHALGTLDAADAALGHAADGGWWALGLRRPNAEAFRGVPMSTARTGRAQEARLRALGLELTLLPTLVDLDTTSDLPAVVASGAAVRTARLAADLGLLPVSAAPSARLMRVLVT